MSDQSRPTPPVPAIVSDLPIPPPSRRKGRRSVPWRKDPIILDRLAIVEPLYVASWSLVAIAARLRVDEGTVRHDIKRITELQVEAIRGTQEEIRAKRITELEDTRRRALDYAEWSQRAERATLLGEVIDGQEVQRDAKGAAQYRGQAAQALTVARQASMDAAKLAGVVVDKQDITSGGQGLQRLYIGVPAPGQTAPVSAGRTGAETGTDPDAQDGPPDHDEGDAGEDES